MSDRPMNPDTAAFARHFVRNTLGCTCPDEVLERIEIENPPGDPPLTRIRVGGRLLIYLLAPPVPERAEGIVTRLLAEGVGERNAGGYNRFRLVLAAEVPADLRAAAEAAFGSAHPDGRTHLHVVEMSEAAPLLSW
jgi:hypothetical protein